MQRPLPLARIVLLFCVASACTDITPPSPGPDPDRAETGGGASSLPRGGATSKKNVGGAGGGTTNSAGRASTTGGRATANSGTSGNSAANTGGRASAGSGGTVGNGGRSTGGNGGAGGASNPTMGGAAPARDPAPGGSAGVGGASERSRPKPPFFSEYVEGSGNNKALELAMAESGRLEGCVIRIYANGSLTASRSIALTGLLTPELPLVICSPQLAATGDAVCGLTESLPFNGNDVVLLACDDAVVDVIGQLGNDPGNAGCGSGPLRTQDQTLRRACSVVAGDREPNDPFDLVQNGWLAAKTDTVEGLGVRCEATVNDGAGGAGGAGGGEGAAGANSAGASGAGGSASGASGVGGASE